MNFQVGFDCAEYRQQVVFGSRKHTTRGLVGVGVACEDVPAFSKAYRQSVASVFKKFNLKQERPVYCAAELSAILGSQSINKEREALELFLKEMLPAMDEINLYYTFFVQLYAGNYFWR